MNNQILLIFCFIGSSLTQLFTYNCLYTRDLLDHMLIDYNYTYIYIYKVFFFFKLSLVFILDAAKCTTPPKTHTPHNRFLS